ncbi:MULTISPECIES: hypothetical protein [unclassified Frankia]|uniref:hypothetical protein n=1 Tax=unclassified Frankia TaxID=2632575 RepID=UPI0020243A2A
MPNFVQPRELDLTSFDGRLVDDRGVVTLSLAGHTATDSETAEFASAFTTAVAAHRHFDRHAELVPA